jgi:hypothetical protein
MRSKPKKKTPQEPPDCDEASDDVRAIIRHLTMDPLPYVGGSMVRDGKLIPPGA